MTNDLISRTEVLKLIYDYKENHSENRKEYPINYGTLIDMIRWIRNLPSVTPQLSSGLEKNSQKLEKDFGELDCISRADARKAIIAHQYSDSFCEEHSIDHSINTGMALIALSDLPSVTPQLCEDVVSRQAVLDLIADYDLSMGHVVRGIHALPSVTPQEPQTFKWCTDCKEYDQEKHCCHRLSKVIRDTVEEMKQEQEPILDKIRAEIERGKIGLDIEFNGGIDYALSIIDKYKTESEE